MGHNERLDLLGARQQGGRPVEDVRDGVRPRRPGRHQAEHVPARRFRRRWLASIPLAAVRRPERQQRPPVLRVRGAVEPVPEHQDAAQALEVRAHRPDVEHVHLEHREAAAPGHQPGFPHRRRQDQERRQGQGIPCERASGERRRAQRLRRNAGAGGRGFALPRVQVHPGGGEIAVPRVVRERDRARRAALLVR